jgi:hypothetical protein
MRSEEFSPNPEAATARPESTFSPGMRSNLETALGFENVKHIEVSGDAVLDALPPDRNVIFVATHNTGADMPVAAKALAERGVKLSVTGMSVHHGAAGLAEPQMLFASSRAAEGEMLKVAYRRTGLLSKEPAPFTPADTDDMMAAMGRGNRILVAGYTPGEEDEPGHMAAYLAARSNAILVPVVVEKNGENANVTIGEPFELENPPDAERFYELSEKRRKFNELPARKAKKELDKRAAYKVEAARSAVAAAAGEENVGHSSSVMPEDSDLILTPSEVREYTELARAMAVQSKAVFGKLVPEKIENKQ